MRRITAILLFCCFVFACKRRHTPEQLEKDLMQTFQASLYQANDNDSSKAKYDVLSVIYYEDVNDFICTFKVHMRSPLLDTTGTMKAHITKDIQKVSRNY